MRYAVQILKIYYACPKLINRKILNKKVYGIYFSVQLFTFLALEVH